MVSKIKIIEAYCVQLGRVIDIDEAHFESLKDAPPAKRLDFLCSSPSCRAKGVKITGASYDRPLSKQQRAMHFRENSHYPHEPDCEWVIFSSFLEKNTPHSSESSQLSEIRQRSASAVDDWITQYVPQKPDIGVHTTQQQPKLQQKTDDFAQIRTKPHTTLLQETHGRTTHSFMRLCRFHNEMLRLNGFAALKEIPLNIIGMGQSSFGHYFQSIKYGLFKKNCILFGWIGQNSQGKYKIKRYGNGFKIQFATKYEHREYGKLPITAYISQQQIAEYRYKKQILDVLNNAQDFAKLTLYVIPESINIHEYDNGGFEAQLLISDLDTFRFIGVAQAQPNTEAA